nr:helix-turn-helix transcriptional regulator [uncultured Desulfobacter sp.]
MIEEWKKDPEFKKEYDRLTPMWELRQKMIALRIEKGLTQEQIAKKMGTKRSNISRLEANVDSFPTYKTLEKYAAALDCKIRIEFEPL